MTNTSMYNIIQRNRRLQKDSSVLLPLPESGTISYYHYLKPLYESSVSSDDFKYALSVIPLSSDKKAAFLSVRDNIIPGLINLEQANDILMKNETLTLNEVSELSAAIDIQKASDRVINNQDKLMKRFSLTGLKSLSPKDAVSEFCSFVDTYEISDYAKYNVCLENSLYTMETIHSSLSDTDIAEAVTEYFLFRESNISDAKYKNLQTILQNNIFYDNDKLQSSTLLREFTSKKPSTFLDELQYIISTNECSVGNIISRVNSAMTENDAAKYIEDVHDMILTNNLSATDRGLLYLSIDYIPKVSGVSQTFVNIEKDKTVDSQDYSYCTQFVDGLTINSEIIKEKRVPTSNLFFTLKEADYADYDKVKDSIEKFKAEQKKDLPLLKRTINKIFASTPKEVIDDVPGLFSIIRTFFILGSATIAPIGPIVALVGTIVNWFINRKCTYDQCKELITFLKKEKSTMESKLDDIDDATKKANAKAYITNLDACIKKVSDHRNNMVPFEDQEDDGDDSSSDLDDIDFSEFESAKMSVDKQAISLAEFLSLINSKDKTAEQLQEMDIHTIITNIANDGLLLEYDEIIKKSSIDTERYLAEVKALYQNKNNTRVVTEASMCLNTKYTEPSPIRALCVEAVSNQILLSAINEGKKINNLKLALQAGKAKLKDLSSKQKSFWQSIDASTSNMYKSIEQSMTSDRREAIIKGSIIPSFSVMVKKSVALAATGVVFGPFGAAVAAIGSFAVNKALNEKEKKLIYDEIDTELHVVEKQLEIAQNDQDMNQYRFLLNYQKKLTRELQRIKYGMKATGRDIPSASAITMSK